MTKITIETNIMADVEKVWNLFSDESAIQEWNHASDDWECPHAENDLKVGGKFLSTMSAKDGSESFDFTGTYTEVEPFSKISYEMDDGREVDVIFEEVSDNETKVVEIFDAEDVNPEDLQRDGWQAILDNFKNYVESH